MTGRNLAPSPPLPRGAPEVCLRRTRSVERSVFQPGVVCHFSRVARASEKTIHNYLFLYCTVYSVYGTTFCRSQNNMITWEKR